MKTLAAGVPMVVMPHGRDQEDNGTRVRVRGAGRVIPRDAGSRRKKRDDGAFLVRQLQIARAVAADPIVG